MKKAHGHLKKVIVVGAGIAGITAARELEARGYGVILLEAWRDVGGRARLSQDMPLGPIVVHEVGQYSGVGGIKTYIKSHPEYLFTEADLPPIQPIPALLEHYGITTIMPMGGMVDSVIVVGTKAKEFNLKDFGKLYQSYREEHSKNYFADLSVCPSLQTLEDHCARALIKTFEEGFSGLTLSELTDIMENLEKNKIDFFQYGDLHPLIGERGYYGLIKAMQNDLKQVDIHFNAEVSSIKRHGEKVIATTKDGKTFEADAVVSTLPLGVLKENKVEIERLSETKRKAIRHLKMGLMNKVLLTFKKQFWTNDCSFFVVMDTSPGERLVTVVLNPNRAFPDKTPVLMGAFFADEAMMDKEALIEMTKKAIKKAWPQSPDPISIDTILWNEDPYSYGSYASFSRETHQDDIVNLMQPEWDGKLVFAGDAVVPVGLMGCFHGAYISAMRAARLIDERLRVL